MAESFLLEGFLDPMALALTRPSSCAHGMQSPHWLGISCREFDSSCARTARVSILKLTALLCELTRLDSGFDGHAVSKGVVKVLMSLIVLPRHVDDGTKML